MTLPVNGEELGAKKVNRSRTKAAIAVDPLPNGEWVDVPKGSGRWIINDLKAEEARTPGRVETKNGIRRNTDAIMRHNPEHKRTGRGTRAINDDLLAGVTKGHIARPIGADIAAAIIRYAHNSGGARCEAQHHQ